MTLLDVDITPYETAAFCALLEIETELTKPQAEQDLEGKVRRLLNDGRVRSMLEHTRILAQHQRQEADDLSRCIELQDQTMLDLYDGRYYRLRYDTLAVPIGLGEDWMDDLESGGFIEIEDDQYFKFTDEGIEHVRHLQRTFDAASKSRHDAYKARRKAKS